MSDIGDDAHVALYINGTPRRWSYAVSMNQMSNAANFYLTRLNVSDRVYLAVYVGEDTISPIQSTFTGAKPRCRDQQQVTDNHVLLKQSKQILLDLYDSVKRLKDCGLFTFLRA
ncbi:hypothetical protein KUTeg_002722 [Tegillarca granosa]|uniref:Uncharacterized protein n=1 Tax=Tegillarca granosa TaxID=220873 RepID=A0ABQ9FVK3_TEGGR|nr:hypothetical protein KUTeg_002722 [Tegillarca granosa]